jgi:DNA-binding transcriptional ArsR family regulator
VTQVGEVNEEILKVLAEEPLSSVRELEQHAWLSRTTVDRHLTCSLSFPVRHPRWVRYGLSDDQNKMRIDLSAALLGLFEG